MTIKSGKIEPLMKFGRIADDLDKSFDLDYWAARTSSERFEAIDELVRFDQMRRGLDHELRLQRAVEHFQRKRD